MGVSIREGGGVTGRFSRGWLGGGSVRSTLPLWRQLTASVARWPACLFWVAGQGATACGLAHPPRAEVLVIVCGVVGLAARSAIQSLFVLTRRVCLRREEL